MERKTVCKNCNKEFIKISLRSQNQYCSEECKCEYYSKKNNSPLNCLNCNKKLKVSRIQSGCKCCCKECSIEYSRRSGRAKEIAEKAKLTRANWSEEKKKSVLDKAAKTRKKRRENMTDEEYKESCRRRSEKAKITKANWSEEKKKSVYEKATKTRKEHKGLTDEEYRESFRRRAEKAKMTRANWSEERVAEEKRKRKERLENMTEEEKREYGRKVSEGKKNSPIKEETYRKVVETRKNKSEEEKEQIRLKIFNSKQWYRDELIAKEVGWENLENFKSPEFNRQFIVTIRNVQYFDIQSAMKFYKAKFRRIRAAMSIYWNFDMPILKLSGVSYEELRIFEYLSNKYQNLTFRSSVNNLIRSPETGSLLELDIVGYIDERPVIAIEYNGIRWHGENGNSDREYLKTCLCGEIGIPLYHIWEHRTEEGLVPVEVFLESLSRKIA